MGLKLRWSVTSVCAPVGTGFALLWPAMVGLYQSVYVEQMLKKWVSPIFFFFFLSGEHHGQELAGEGGEEEEMTEEEWSRRVAELKALQVH